MRVGGNNYWQMIKSILTILIIMSYAALALLKISAYYGFSIPRCCPIQHWHAFSPEISGYWRCIASNGSPFANNQLSAPNNIECPRF